jgi:hypothetical protein
LLDLPAHRAFSVATGSLRERAQPPYHPMNAPSITSPKKQIPSNQLKEFT